MKTMTTQQDCNKFYCYLQRVTFEMTPLDLIRPPLVDEQSIPRARVVVTKLNFTHWRKLRDTHILGIGTGDCTKVRSSLLSAILRFAFKTWI